MPLCRLALCAALALAALPVAAQPGARTAAVPPAYDVLDYAFAVDVLDSSLVRASATLRVATPPCPRGACAAPGLALDLIGRMPGSRFGMTVDSVLAAPDVGRAALAPVRWQHAADRLSIEMPTASAVAAPATPGATGSAVWRVRVVYHGQPADGLIRSTDAAGQTAYFGDNWPERARHYLPTRDHPSDKATVTWTVTAPAALTVVANGRFEARTCTASACQTRYRADVPISTKVMVFGAAPFAIETAGEVVGSGGRRVAVESWVFADERAAGFREYSAAVPIVAFFDSLLAPFPFEKLANVQSRTRFGGMENAGAIFYNARSARGDGSQEGLLAHEIAHQWFGNWATEASWSHLWLSEGFATYLAHVWAAHRRGDAALRVGMAADRVTVAAFLARTRVPVVDTVRTEPLEMLDANVYPRGAWVLHLLRERAGERVFWTALRRYLLRHGRTDGGDVRFAGGLRGRVGRVVRRVLRAVDAPLGDPEPRRHVALRRRRAPGRRHPPPDPARWRLRLPARHRHRGRNRCIQWRDAGRTCGCGCARTHVPPARGGAPGAARARPRRADAVLRRRGRRGIVSVRRAFAAALVASLSLAACDASSPSFEPGLVVEGIVETGEAAPVVTLRRARAPGDPGDDSADGAAATFAVDGLPVALVGMGQGRYRAVLPAPLAPGQQVALSARWDGAPAVSALTRVVAPMRLDSVRVTRTALPVRAALIDELGFGLDPALIAEVVTREGFVYPVTVTAYWRAAPSSDGDEAPWVRLALRPSATVAVRFFFPSETVLPEARTTATPGGGRQMRLTYAVEAANATAPLSPHRLRVAVVRGGAAYARFVETRSAPERREPVSNVTGGRGLFAAVSTDSVRVVVE